MGYHLGCPFSGSVFASRSYVQGLEKVPCLLHPFQGIADVLAPIVCRDANGLEDGTILFRYPGQSGKIKFGDLLAMLRERDKVATHALLASASRLSDRDADAFAFGRIVSVWPLPPERFVRSK